MVAKDGNVTFSQPISIDDGVPSEESRPSGPASQERGDAITCTASHTITQADMDAGSVTTPPWPRG